MTNSASTSRSSLPLTFFFILITALLLLGKKPLQARGVDMPVLFAGNLLLFAVSLGSLLLYQRAMAHPTTMGFLRHTYSGLFLKLLVCIFAILLYVVINRTEHINKPAILACVFLYFIYSLLEMRSLMQWNKARRNA